MTKISSKPKQSYLVKAQDDLLSKAPCLDSGLDFLEFSEGQKGFSEAKSIILRMVEAGYEDIDIVISLHEHVSPEIVEKALHECRKWGIL